MKRVLKEISRIIVSGTYNDFRLIITSSSIELKLIPKKDSDTEVVWFINNTEDRIRDLYWQLSQNY